MHWLPVHTFESVRRHGVVSTSVVRMIRGLVVAVLLCVAMLGQSDVPPRVHRFELADCDDVAFGPDGDLYFAWQMPLAA